MQRSLVLLGAVRDGAISWYDYYDDRELDRFTEFQLAAYELRLSTAFSRGVIECGRLNVWENNVYVLLVSHRGVNNELIAAISFFGGPPGDVGSLQRAVEDVLSREVPYFAKKFVSEVMELLEPSGEVSEDLGGDALELLRNRPLGELSPDRIGLLIREVLATEVDTELLVFLVDVAHELLGMLTPEMDKDIPLDSCYFLAEYMHLRELELERAVDLFLSTAGVIEDLAVRDRLGLRIRCLLAVSRIVHQHMPNNFLLLKECIDRIDDGDLQVVGQSEWEQYYVYQGHVYWKMGDTDSAFMVYEMAVDLAEDSPDPTFEVAEAYLALAGNSANLMKLDTAVQQALAAWSIALRYRRVDFAQRCLDQAAEYEVTWSEWLSHSGLLKRMENHPREAVHDAWRALKLVLTAYAHGSPKVREGISVVFPSVFKNIQLLILEYYEDQVGGDADIARKIVSDVNSSFALFLSGTVWEEEMMSRLEFLKAQISSLLPRRVPTFLLIANDGRLMCAGKVTESDWSEIGIEEDLLSGALSAIMSLLSEVTDTNAPLRSINAGETIIQMEWTPFAIGALITDRESGALTQGMKRAMEKIITHFDSDLLEWDGFSIDFLSVIPGIVNEIFTPLLEEV